MSSLRERIERLERDLLADPPRISAYHDLPFTIFRYDPSDEFPARKECLRLATRLQNARRRVHFISLGEILWKAIRETEGIAAIAKEERKLGFDRAQRTVSTLLSDKDFTELPVELVKRMEGFDPAVDCAFLVRAGALAPAIYRCAKLLDELHGRTMVPVVLFYPGTTDAPEGEGATSLRFMGMEERQGAGTYNYRVKIY
ncbi:MAG: DUF1788 domain-containing protein [Deltaproteobacteria bacterium]|nr:DUF1788 domain-containing protein [Deltaproteobacteria bacterium]